MSVGQHDHRMAAISKQARLLVCSRDIYNNKRLCLYRRQHNMVGIRRCLKIGNDRYLIDQSWKVEAYIPIAENLAPYYATFFASLDL
jgi:hypothetical protein